MKEKLHDYKVRMVFAMKASSVALFIVGIIGFATTFISYGRIGVWMFALYLVLAGFCVGLGIALCVHSRTVKKIFDKEE